MEVLLKSTIVWADKAEKEKADLELVIKEAMDSASKRVVDRYKGSDLFQFEVSETVVELKFIGFEDCRAKAIQLFPDFSALVMDIGEEAEGEIPIDVGVDHPIEPA